MVRAAFRTPALSVLAGLLFSTSVYAQSAPRYVSFGDSLSDNGNLYLLTSGMAPPYPSHRFSSGLSYAELLAGPMLNFPLATPATVNLGNINYAVGGSRTSGPMTPGPTTEQQIGTFLASGGRFAPGDVVTFWAGANNLFQGIPVAAANPATAQATMAAIAGNAASDVGAQIRTLAQAGARTVVTLNLPDFGGLPAYNFGAGIPANQLAGFASGAFNAGWSAETAAAAAANPGTNIIGVDVAGLFRAVQANPAGFGLINAREACINVASCLAGGAAAANGFAFWDEVHPTEAGYRLVVAATEQTVNAPVYATSFAAMGEIAFEDRRGGMLRALDRVEGTRNLQPGLNRYFIQVLGGATNADGSLRRAGYDWRNYGVTFGVDRAMTDQWGLSLGGTVTTGTLKSGPTETSPTNFALDGALQYSAGPLFGKVAFGLGVTDFGDTKRRTVGPLENTSSTTALAANIGAEVGTLHQFGSFSLSPRARLGWISASVDGFGETGVVAPMSINSRTVNALIAGAELRFGVNLINEAARRFDLHATVGYERNLAYSGANVAGRLTGNTAFPFTTALADPKGAGIVLGAGLSGSLGGGIELTGDYKVQLGHGEALRHIGQAGLRVSF